MGRWVRGLIAIEAKLDRQGDRRFQKASLSISKSPAAVEKHVVELLLLRYSFIV